MGNNQQNNNLESARLRLEQALARLSQNVTDSKQATADTTLDQNEAASAYSALEERFQAVEQENLRLHEQIATLSLSASSDANDTDSRVATLEAEKHAIQQNYDLLKHQYTSLQDEFEGLQNTIGPVSESDADTAAEMHTLRSALDAAVSERDVIRTELDQVINELEGYLAQNTQAAGGMN